MTSSVRAKMVEQIRAAKRKAKEIGNAIEKGIESANDKLEHLETVVGGVSAEASSSDSTETVAKTKAAEKKTPAKKKRAA